MKPWLTGTAFAHRGLHDGNRLVAENSLPAFMAARDAGYGIELDVRLSRDGVVMVFHDERLDRMTAERGAVDQRTAAELGSVELIAGGGPIATLSQVLELLDGTAPLLIEVKQPDHDVESLAAATTGCLEGYKGAAAVMSFNPLVSEWLRRNAPEVPRGMVTTNLDERGEDIAGWAPTDLRQALAEDLGDPRFYAHDIRYLPDDTCAHARAKGVPLLTWTVRTQAERERAAHHADAIIFEFLRP